MPTGSLVGYCIRGVGDGPPPPGLAGVGDAPVRQVVAAGLAIWLSAERPAPPTLERIRAHDAVVRAALESATPLPLRYGSHFAGEDEAAQLLRSRAAAFSDSLRRVAGRVEMGVRVLWEAGPPSAAGSGSVAGEPHSGREYLESRRAALREQEAQTASATALLDRLDRLFPDIPAVRLPGTRAGVAGSVAHLVQRTMLQQYVSLVQAAREDLVEVRLVLTGPWAPYSFV